MKKLLLLGFVLFFQLGFSQTKLDPNSPVLKGIKLEKINDSKFDTLTMQKFHGIFPLLISEVKKFQLR